MDAILDCLAANPRLFGAGLLLGLICLGVGIYRVQKHHQNVSYDYKIFGLKNLILGFIASLSIICACYRIEGHHLTDGGMFFAFVALCCIAFLLWKNIRNTSKFVGIVIVPMQLVVGLFSIFLALCLLGKIDEWFFRRKRI